MIRETVHALAACVLTFVLCAIAYPAAVWGLGWLLFPKQAEGSLISGRDRMVIGSELVAQPFASDSYFHPRPSAVDYNAAAAGGSNLGTKNPDLRAKIKERAEALKATPEDPVPPELVTASGGGLDPHLTPRAARYQAARVAAARKLPVERVRALIDRLTEHSGAIIGAPARINVLRLNLALDEEKPEPASASAGTESRSDAAPKSPGEAPAASDSGATAPAPAAEARLAHPDLASDVAALRSQVGDVSDRLQQLLDRLGIYTEAIAHDKAGHDKTQAELKGLEDRVAKLAEDSRHVPQLVEHVSTLDERVKSAEETLRALQAHFKEAQDALKEIETKAAPSPGSAPTARRPRG